MNEESIELEEKAWNFSSKEDVYEWDVFISHASEDKEDVARPLAGELLKKGLKVWYDEFSLTVGDSLREKIDDGLVNSRFGVVILSENFLSKKWTVKELDGLFTREIFGEKVILPVLHDIDIEDLAKISPIMASKLALNTDIGIENVTDEILMLMAGKKRKIADKIEKLKQERLKILLNDLNKKYNEKLNAKTEIENIENEYIEPDMEIKVKKRLLDFSSANFIIWEDTSDPYKSISVDEILTDDRDYLIVGEAGIGKTSILYWMGLQIANDKINPEFIPLYVPLKTIANINNKDELFSILETMYNIKKYYLKDYNILFLLDGLDQLADYSNIRDRLEYKDIFGPENRIIFTTRPTGYEWMKDNLGKNDSHSYEYLKILPFNDEKIEKYMGDQYLDRLFLELFQNNKELISIPILLKLVKELLSEKELIQVENRTDLYDRFIKYLFKKWEKSKKGTSLSLIDASKILKDLPDISYKALEDRFIGSVPFEKAGEYVENLDDLKILIEWSVTHNLGEKEGDDVFSYTHQSFQEYFASIRLKEELLKNSEIDHDILIEKMEYNYWDEVWIFLVGGLPHEKSKEIIELINEHDPLLAASCIIEYKGDKNDFQETIDFKEIINEIIKELENDLWNVQTKGIDIIGLIGTDKDLPDLIPLLSYYYIKDHAAEAIGKIVGLNDLLPLLKDENGDVRLIAVESIGKIGSEENVKEVLPLVKDDESEVRLSAVEAIGKIGTGKNVKDLIPLLKDDVYDIIESTTEAIVEIGSAENVKELIPLLKEEDLYDTINEIICNIGSSENVKDLIPLLKDEESYVRQSAAEAIGEIGSNEFVKDLIPLLKDEESYVRQNAAEAIGKIGTEDNVKNLIPLLKEDDYDLNLTVALAIGEIGSEENVKDLIPLLKDEESVVRKNAVLAIGRIGSEENVKDLIPLLKDEESEVQGGTAIAIGRIGSEENLKDLIPLLKDEESGVRESAALAIGRMGSEENVKDLIPLLKDEKSEIRQLAADLIGGIGSEENVKDVLPLLKDEESEVRESAAEAIAEIGTEENVNDLILLLKDDESEVRESAADAIAKIGIEKNIMDLLHLLQDQRIIREVNEAIGIITSRLDQIDQDNVIQDILLSDLNVELADNAIEAIKRKTGRRFLKLDN